MSKPTDEQLLFTGLLASVGLGNKEVAAFCQVTPEHAEEWKSAGRRMPFEIALSLIWLAKHILAKQIANQPKASILLLVPTPAQEAIERSKEILELMLEVVSWWPSKHYEAAQAYTAKRGGRFDLTPRTYQHIIWDSTTGEFPS
jgi:hypothetical protein